MSSQVLVSTKEKRGQSTAYAVVSSPNINGKAIHIGMSANKGIYIKVCDYNSGKMHETVQPIDQFVDDVLAIAEAQRNAKNLLQKQEG